MRFHVARAPTDHHLLRFAMHEKGRCRTDLFDPILGVLKFFGAQQESERVKALTNK